MWIDEILITGGAQQLVNDSKTPSGRVHIGALRGVLLHDVINRKLKSAGIDSKFSYGIDDYDPLDGLPSDGQTDLDQYMGKPLCNIPAPRGSDKSDLAEHYISEFLEVFTRIGVKPEIYRMRDVYRSGSFNEAIDAILRNAASIRDVYLKVSGAKRSEDWHPFQVVCERCGKIGTTEVTAYDGKEVTYRCRPDLVKWAAGCGYTGKISPFNGNGKLPWKLEWPAKWHTFGVTIEGAGKDHCTSGGSRDVANACYEAVFKKTPPLNVPYEFFLVEGAKMSSSKGIGSSAKEMADFLPPEILRYLILRTVPKRTVNFSTSQEFLVKLFNDYDALVEKVKSGSATNDDRTLLAMTSPANEITLADTVSFQVLTTLLQLPHIDPNVEIAKRLGVDTDSIPLHVKRRVEAANYWIDQLATPEDKLILQQELPISVWSLTHSQRWFLNRLASTLQGAPRTDEALQSHVFDIARCTPIPQPMAFEAIYRALFDSHQGPKVGSLFNFLSTDFLEQRFSSALFSMKEALIETSTPFTEFEGSWPELIKKARSPLFCRLLLMVDRPHKDSNLNEKNQLGGYGFIEIQWADSHDRRHLTRVLYSSFDGFGTTPHKEWMELVAQGQSDFNSLADKAQAKLEWDTSTNIHYEDSHVTVH